MITLYDLAFDGDRRPSPYCWRAKLALKHKGLKWRDEPMGFNEKQKIAFAALQHRITSNRCVTACSTDTAVCASVSAYLCRTDGR